MRSADITVDYFLYDNRTPSVLSGPDWNVKRQTGALSERKDLYRLFHKYGTLTHGDPKHPADFSAAIGGIRPPEGQGYLLCVTLEATDMINRPSFVVVGLWCPDHATLQALVNNGDLVESARTVLTRDPPRSALKIVHRPQLRPCPLKAPDGAAVLRFKRNESVKLALELIRGAASSETVPAILGITASPMVGEIAKRERFGVVFAKPMDERSEQALRSIESSADVLVVSEPRIAVIDSAPSPPEPANDIRPREQPPLPEPPPPLKQRLVRRVAAVTQVPESAMSPLWSLLLATAAIGATFGLAFGASTVLLLIFWYDWRPLVRSGAVQTSPPSAVVRPATTSHAPLDAVVAALKELRTLDPQLLIQSPGFLTADTVAVVQQHEEDRARVRLAYSTLLKRRDSLIHPSWIASLYYLYGIGKGAPADERQHTLAQLLRDASVESECLMLERAFGDEMASRDSLAANWCRVFASVERTIQALDVTGGNGAQSPR